MKHRINLTGLLLLATMLASACGNFSNEDLIFFAALPRAEDVSLRVPGADYGQEQQRLSSSSQPLVACADDDLRCLAGRISTDINAGVLAMLDMVDHMALDYPPSHREPGLRLWGPVYLPEQNLSIRFEMRRLTDDRGVSFVYCLHALRGEANLDLANTIGCEVEDDPSGLKRILRGQYFPAGEAATEANNSAAQGQGELLVDLNRSRDAGLGKLDDQGRLLIAYQNDATALHINLQIRELVDPQTLLPGGSDYNYLRRADGSGTFDFVVNADFIDGFILSRLENLHIQAAWTACESGQAQAQITGGDLDADQQIEAAQCWDCAGVTGFYHDSDLQHPDQGSADSCVDVQW